MDIISELERMGDFIINISQSLQRTYVVAKW
jgi:phosphate uptake regulator